jgi:hypothetical protein
LLRCLIVSFSCFILFHFIQFNFVYFLFFTSGGDDDAEEDGTKGYHVFGWRDWFDIAIRWRQYSEPMDVVYWLDRLDLPDDQVQCSHRLILVAVTS